MLVTVLTLPLFFHPSERTPINIASFLCTFTFKPMVKTFHCSLSVFLIFFSRWGKMKSTIPEVGRTDTSKTFLLKKVYLKLKENSDGSD